MGDIVAFAGMRKSSRARGDLPFESGALLAWLKHVAANHASPVRVAPSMPRGDVALRLKRLRRALGPVLSPPGTAFAQGAADASSRSLTGTALASVRSL